MTTWASMHQKIKDSLLKYSVGIVYRLSKFIRNEIDKKISELNNLDQDILRIEGIKTTLMTKIDTIQRSIDKQNAEINIILRNVMFYQMSNNKNTQNMNTEIKQNMNTQNNSFTVNYLRIEDNPINYIPVNGIYLLKQGFF